MLRLLLDLHLPFRIAEQLRGEGHDVEHLSQWRHGHYRTAADRDILSAAVPERRTLVTYDLRSIPRLLKEIIESGDHHGGVIFVDGNSIRSDDIGTIIQSLGVILRESRDDDWSDRITFLRPGR